MAHVIGIDLGTSNSCVAYIKDGQPEVIRDSAGNATMPSVFAISSTNEPIVGHEAKAQQSTNKQNTIFAVKRLIGRKFESKEVKEAKNNLPYKVIRAPNGDAWVEINGNPTSPEEVSSQILTKMKQIAEEFLGEPVFKAVITVPAYFNDAQRQATKEAGMIAGLEVMRIINEPTAAALAYGMDVVAEEQKKAKNQFVDKADKVIAVFDLGGGTFDVTILEMREGVFNVLSTNGDTFLGGEDFDLAIVEYLIKHFKEKTGHDLSKDKNALQRLNVAAREAKHGLTEQNSVNISIPFMASGNQHFELEITRRMLEKIVEPILSKLEEPCLKAMEDAGLGPSGITDVILVGGMTRMPAVKSYCGRIFKCVPHEDVDPDEAVALGAAVQGGLLQGIVKGVSFLDVTSLSLGIEVQGGKTHVIIPRNSSIPVAISETFTTSAPNQPQVSVHIIQGESDFAPENKSLGMFELTGIKLAPRGVPDIEVTFNIDHDGVVNVSAKDRETGQEKSIEIIADSGLSDVEIDRLLKDKRMEQEQRSLSKQRAAARSNEVQDDGELGKLKEELRSVVFTTQAKLNTEGRGFKGKGRSQLESALLQARTALDTATEEVDLITAKDNLIEKTLALDSFIDSLI